MPVRLPFASTLVSPALVARILATPKLQQSLLPEGLACSPYAVLDYEATLVLPALPGGVAHFVRTQRIRFLQDGVAAILDHYWGEGILLTNYANSAGRISQSFRDGNRRHLVIQLPRPMDTKEELTFRVERTAMIAFPKNEEWFETIVDHPTERLTRRIRFPRERPCQSATLRFDRHELRLPIHKEADGGTSVRFEVLAPGQDVAYTVHWSW